MQKTFVPEDWVHSNLNLLGTVVGVDAETRTVLRRPLYPIDSLMP